MNQHLTNYGLVAEPDPPREADRPPQRGQRAARLRLAKSYILSHSHEPGLNAQKIGKQLAISGRAVQMLFETEGTTLSNFVLETRLFETLRRLRDPAYDTVAISQIAYAAGFVDLSHFNRCFRKRYGETPSEARRNMA